MHQIIDASAESLVPFVQHSVAPGSLIHTDGWRGYLLLESKGYDHEVTVMRGKKNLRRSCCHGSTSSSPSSNGG